MIITIKAQKSHLFILRKPRNSEDVREMIYFYYYYVFKITLATDFLFAQRVIFSTCAQKIKTRNEDRWFPLILLVHIYIYIGLSQTDYVMTNNPTPLIFLHLLWIRCVNQHPWHKNLFLILSSFKCALV